MAKVLIADDEVTMVQMIAELLRNQGHEVFPFTNGNAALEAIESISPELVVSDLYLDKTRAQGLDILGKARALNPPAIVIMMTAFGSIETAVGAMKSGAYDYLEKPFKVDDFLHCVQRALSYNDAISENVYLRKQLKRKYQFSQIVGQSPLMQDVFKLIERVADTDSTVLVLGESGTGKELVAKALHYNSRRQTQPFIPVNCSALPEALLESELFGHRRGAFTGAITDKKGLFQEADGGTIFLDEIGTMSPVLQSRLLRVLQEKEVRRVGDNTPVQVNVRVVAATNENLEERVKEGTFREDLFYRLNVIPVELPALRERRDDVALLISHFLRNRVHRISGKPFQITRQAVQALTDHPWPGNVRELENAVERACALADSPLLRLHDFPPAITAGIDEPESDTTFTALQEPTGRIFGLHADGKPIETAKTTVGTDSTSGSDQDDPPSMTSLKNFIRSQEINHINRALAQSNGDKDQAATILGVSLATLYRKLADHDIEN
jgi:DNA-binding NtrC family response regulator